MLRALYRCFESQIGSRRLDLGGMFARAPRAMTASRRPFASSLMSARAWPRPGCLRRPRPLARRRILVVRPPRERPISWRERLDAHPPSSRPPSAGGREESCYRSSGRLPVHVALVQRIKDNVPDPGERPAPDLSTDACPLRDTRVEITQRRARTGDPEHRFQDHPMIGRCLPLRGPRAPETSRRAPTRRPTSDRAPQPVFCKEQL